jgi:hypothetical protein
MYNKVTMGEACTVQASCMLGKHSTFEIHPSPKSPLNKTLVSIEGVGF